jgi:hypothetical protein
VAVRERAGTGPLLLVKVRELKTWRVDQRNLERRKVGLGSFARIQSMMGDVDGPDGTYGDKLRRHFCHIG